MIKRKLNPTKDIPNPSVYIKDLESTYEKWAFSEERVLGKKGQWRSTVFEAPSHCPLDLEIGTGTGYHFAYRTQKAPERKIVGLELKYKPLIQSIRRAVKLGCENGRMARYHAFNIQDLFASAEIDNVYIHFPDPWERPRKFKHRLLNREFLTKLYELQKAGSFVEFKTDSLEYYKWAREEILASPYTVEFETTDLHRSSKKDENFITGFERIFINQGIKINQMILRKS